MNIAPPLGTDEKYLQHVDNITGRNLPTLIDAPGWYRTRGGWRAYVSDCHRDTTSSHKVSGHIIIKDKPYKQTWKTWSANGRFMFVGKSEYDIISKE